VRPNVPYFKPDGFRDLRANLLYSLSLLALWRSKHQFDVVDCNATPFLHLFSSRLLAKRWGSVFLVTAHEALADTMRGYFRARQSPLAPIMSACARGIYYSSQRLGNRIIACGQITALNLRAEGFNAVDISSGGVSGCDRPKVGAAGRAVFVGRLVPNKRVHVLLEAFALAAKRGSVKSLTLVGDGPERGRLERLAFDLGVGSMTRFLGDVTDDVKWRVLVKEADIFISASPREGVAIAVLEAMAAGNPAIISHIPGRFQQGSLEYLRDGYNGLVTDGSPSSLAASLHRLCADQDTYELLSRNAVNTAGEYTWDSVASRLEQIYDDALAPRTRHETLVRYAAVESAQKTVP
jgi:L-malate glycosyltransferase